MLYFDYSIKDINVAVCLGELLIMPIQDLNDLNLLKLEYAKQFRYLTICRALGLDENLLAHNLTQLQLSQAASCWLSEYPFSELSSLELDYNLIAEYPKALVVATNDLLDIHRVKFKDLKAYERAEQSSIARALRISNLD